MPWKQASAIISNIYKELSHQSNKKFPLSYLVLRSKWLKQLFRLTRVTTLFTFQLGMDSGGGDVGKEMPFIKLSINTYSVFTLDFLTEINISAYN